MLSPKLILPLTIIGCLVAGITFAQQPGRNITISSMKKSSEQKVHNTHSVVKPRQGGAGNSLKTGALADMHPLNPVISQALGDSFNFSNAGDAAAKQSAWQEAERNYQRALALVPDNRPALYGMAKCADIKGDTITALRYYRTAIYSHDPSHYGTVPGDGYQENMVDKLMEYVLLLNRTGQSQEALSVYNRAAGLLDYEDGRPVLRVTLPQLVVKRTLPVQVRYTPERLQALAEIAIAHIETVHGDYKEASAHIQDAIRMYPDSPVTNYYLGEGLLRTNDPDAKAAYQKAIQLGDDQTIAAAKERIEMCR